jgi:hypothetical protein
VLILAHELAHAVGVSHASAEDELMAPVLGAEVDGLGRETASRSNLWGARLSGSSSSRTESAQH